MDYQVAKLEINYSQGIYDILTSGIFEIILLTLNHTWCQLNITRSIEQIRKRIPFFRIIHGTNIVNFDAITYEPTTMIDYYFHCSNSCQSSIVCYYNPVRDILFCITMFFSLYPSLATQLHPPYLAMR